MCKYCTAEDEICTEEIIKKDIDILGTAIPFELFIPCGKMELRICTSQNYMNPVAKKKIKFCPMCGRKLNTD